MGNGFWCRRCDIEKFTLSQDCADQFFNDNGNTKLSGEERWRLKLKCLDEAHSKRQDLTPEAFDQLMDKLMKQFNTEKVSGFCKNRDLLVECLAQNPHCMLNCKREMDEFIDCVDTIRVYKMKERVQQSTKKRQFDIEAFLNT